MRGRLGGRPTRANFRTGTLTVCTMVPMRSVPHRVVCLLGLDDGVFPRNPRPDGDDVLARNPAIGERDARGEDRQLMLDAILAAKEHLVITYTGADERTGATRPPAVPLGELLDSLDETATGADGSPIGRADTDPTPFAALRSPQRHTRDAGPTRAVHLRSGRPAGRPRHRRAPAPPTAVPGRAVAGPPRSRRRPRRSDRAPAASGPRIPAPTARRGHPVRGGRAVRQPDRRIGQPAEMGGRRSAAARPPVRDRRGGLPSGRVAAWRAAARAAGPGHSGRGTGRGGAAGGSHRGSGRAAPPIGGRVGAAGRRSRAARHGDRRARHRGGDHRLQQTWCQATAFGVDRAARARRRAPGPAVDGRGRRPRRTGSAAQRDLRPARSTEGPGAT